MGLLRKLAFPFALLYGLGVHLRNFLYDTGVFSSFQPRTRTICVGNLSVGGTGKTPMIEFLLRLLRPTHKVAVLSRGYRRKTKGFLLAEKGHTAEDLGDEPLQLFKKFDDLILAVDANRRHGITMLEAMCSPDVILLDDAFQHRKVKADVNILLTAYDHLYSRDVFLPTGYLRDSRKQARRADLIVVTKCPQDMGEVQMASIKKELHPTGEQEVFFASLEYDPILYGNKAGTHLKNLAGKKITLVTGIARPEPLVNYLLGQGLDVDHRAYPDHHFFSDKEIASLRNEPYLLTTEKDFMRLGGLLGNLWYIRVRHRFIANGEERFSERLLRR